MCPTPSLKLLRSMNLRTNARKCVAKWKRGCASTERQTRSKSLTAQLHRNLHALVATHHCECNCAVRKSSPNAGFEFLRSSDWHFVERDYDVTVFYAGQISRPIRE